MKIGILGVALATVLNCGTAVAQEEIASESYVESSTAGMRRLDYVIGAVPKNTTIWKYKFTNARRDVVRVAAHWTSRINYDLELWAGGVLVAASRNSGTKPEEIEVPRLIAGPYTVRVVRRGTYLPFDVIEVWVEYATR